MKSMTLASTSLLILLVLAVLLLAPGALRASVAIKDSLPLSQHALTGHQGQAWNAASIQDYMNRGRCTPKQYSCAALDFTVRYCEIKPGLSIGLIIGSTVRQVVTGFAAKTKYWESRCR